MASSQLLPRLSRFLSGDVCRQRSVTDLRVKVLIRSVHGAVAGDRLPTKELANKEITRLQSPVPDIPDYYRGKSVFITGGTGFMGKVLVERILATCPDVGNLYLLMRGKEDLTPEQRLRDLKNSKVFEVLREKNPHQLDKIVGLCGDMTQPQCGFSTDDRAKLNEVSLIFHVAASLRLNEPIKDSVANNLRPTMSLLALGDTLPKLEVFIHVSTGYSNADLTRIEEKVYPPPMEVETLFDLIDNQNLDEKQQKTLLGSKPTSYVFTKSMAEYEVAKHGGTNFSVAVFRPGAVICTVRNPFPGWIENMNGPSGIIAGTSTGVLKVIGIKGSARVDLVPVDTTIDTLIAAGWELAVDRPAQVRVYNCTGQENPITGRSFADAVNEFVVKYPSVHAVTYPYLRINHYRFSDKILVTLLQTMPIHLIDYTLALINKKYNHRLLKALNMVQEMREVLFPFASKDFEFVNENAKKLRRRLSEKDKKLFNLDPFTVDWHEVMLNLVKGTRRYVLMEPDHTLEEARSRVRKMNYVIKAAKGVGILAGFKVFSNYFK